jgi:tRNA (guanine37-N1)-methyltransferase
MHFNIITLFPELYHTFFSVSIVKRAIEHNKINFTPVNIYDFCDPKKRIDSPVVGGAEGMLLGVNIIEKCFESVQKNYEKKPLTIFFSPQGTVLNQALLKEVYNKAIKDHDAVITTFASRYEGHDKRAEEYYADYVISIGDFVSMGGDLPAMIFIESLLRLHPTILGNDQSALNDSFEKNTLDCDHYANPDEWKEKSIPSILKSGNHKKIKEWRYNNSLKKTLFNRFDWWRNQSITIEEKKSAQKIIPSHYVALLHNDVMLPSGEAGESSVTITDIHDISRSARTYGLKGYYVVTRLKAQKNIVDEFLNFWHEEDKKKSQVNNRFFALENTYCMSELEDVINDIKQKEKKDPLVIVTSSRRDNNHENMISFNDQKRLWILERPVLFVLGTAHGISPEVMKKIEYRLIPLEGIEEFNFLSVRSAAAVLFDRWFGLTRRV